MIGPREVESSSPDPGTALATVRVSSGNSARLGAIAVAGLLVTVIWIAVSDPSAVTLDNEALAATVPASNTPAASAGPSGPLDLPGPGAVAAASSNRFSIVATIGGRQFITLLEEDGSGNLAGSFEVTLPLAATKGTIEFSQVWMTVSHDAWATIGAWQVGFEPIAGASRREHVVLDVSMRPRRTVRNAPPPVARGYRITVRAQGAGAHGNVWVDINLGPRGQLEGNDGIFGWPVVAQLDPPAAAPTR